MRTLSSLCLAALVSFSATNTCHGGLLINGGFEAPALPAGTFMTIAPGGEPAGFAWHVSSGTVDLGDGPNAFVQFPPFEGNQGLDLNGNERGACSRTLRRRPVRRICSRSPTPTIPLREASRPRASL